MNKSKGVCPEFLTEAEVAHIIKAKRGTLGRWREEKKGPPHHKLGGLVRYEKQELLAWIAEQKREVRK